MINIMKKNVLEFVFVRLVGNVKISRTLHFLKKILKKKFVASCFKTGFLLKTTKSIIDMTFDFLSRK